MAKPGIEEILARLVSLDANDRVKAAAELGEVGGPNEAKELLKAVFEDGASTVRQMAIQSYFEILREDGLEELLQVAKNHADLYVRVYAVSVLGNLEAPLVANYLLEFLKDDQAKIRITSTRAMIHANARINAEALLTAFSTEPDSLVRRNIIEAFGIWKFKSARELVNNYLKNQENLEEKTVALFALAAFGDKKAKKSLEIDEIDEFTSLMVNKKRFRGRSGILKALNEL